MSASASTTIAELAAVTDAVERMRDRVVAMTEPWLGTDREDVVTALYEAERQIIGAQRALRRAQTTLED